MSRTPVSFLNYLRHQVYVNAITDTDKSDYIGKTFDITTDIQAIKNYLGIDSTYQKNAFNSYTDLTDYFLIIDDSWFTKDQTTIEVTDIYFSDSSDLTRYDGSMMLFTKDNLVDDYTIQDSSAILHFKFQIKKFPDITDFLTYSFPVFISPNMQQIANDLIVQFDVNFISLNFFTEHSLLMSLKEYIQTQYVTQLNPKLTLDFIGWNTVNLIDYSSMLNDMILGNLSSSLGKEWQDIRPDMAKQYIHDTTTIIKMVQKVDTQKILDMFKDTIMEYYENHLDQTVDMFAGFTTDAELYDVAYQKQRLQPQGNLFIDNLRVNFLRFVLVRNNIYSWKFTILQDGTEFQSDFIKFKVRNIVPNWTYDFSFTNNGFAIDLTTDHTTNIPLKIDILEYSNNLVQTSSVPYSRFINEYYYNEFTLKFSGNKLNMDYGYNSIRLFLSDSLSETYKDIRYAFVYAPQDVISQKIAKIKFSPQYSNIQNTQNPDKLLPLSEDFSSYYDLSARLSGDSTLDWMWVQIPVDYELIYSKNVPLTIEIDTTDATGQQCSQFQYLDWDITKQEITLAPTLSITDQNKIGQTFMFMFRYKFNNEQVYTDEIIQKMNGLLHVRLYPTDVDTTDDNWFEEFTQVQFVTTRFKLRTSSHEPVAAKSYREQETVEFKPTFSTQNTFSVVPSHQYIADNTYFGGQMANFTIGGDKPGATEKPLVNRTCTIKSIPITVDYQTREYFEAGGKKVYDKVGDGTVNMRWVSPQIGYVKEMENFAKDGILRSIDNAFMRWVITDLFNWYMAHVENDIQLTFRPNFSKCYVSTSYKAEFIDSMLTCDSAKNGQTVLKYVFDTYGLDHTSANAYNITDLGIAESKMDHEADWGCEAFHMYELGQSYSYQLDVNFARSDIYNMADFATFVKEAFVNKYFSEIMPSEYKFTKYGDQGRLNSSGYYTYGDNFRGAYFGGLNGKGTRDTSSDLAEFIASNGYGINYITRWFCDNITMDFTTRTGDLLHITPKEVLDLYFSDNFDSSGALNSVSGHIGNLFLNALSQSIKVKRVYSADLSASLSNITDELFSIHIEPTELAPLYSSFRFTDIKFIYDTNVITLTELFDKKEITSSTFKTNEVLGTGIDIQCKYLNHSFSQVPMGVLIYYRDEYGYEKTVSVDLVLRERLLTFTQSAMSDLVRWGVNTLKGLWMMQVFETNNQVIQDTCDALKSSVDQVMANDEFGITDTAKQFWGGLFEAKKQYFATYKKYLNDDILNGFYYSWLENKLYGRPCFNFSTSMSMFVLPENIELMEAGDPTRIWADDLVYYTMDSSYKANSGQTKDSKLLGGDYAPFINYKSLIENYYDNYSNKRGYDINLILLPDTTYNISLKTFLVFNWSLKAGEKEIPTLSQQLSAMGEDDMACAVNFREFLTLARMYPNLGDLVRGILRDLFIPLNFERYGRLPSAEHPITVNNYYPNQYEADYNTFIESGTFYYEVKEKSSAAHFGLVIPFEKILVSVDTTSTGIFDINFINFSKSKQDTQFVDTYENMAYTNITVGNWKNKVKVSVQVPSVIPQKYIDVTVKPLF